MLLQKGCEVCSPAFASLPDGTDSYFAEHSLLDGKGSCYAHVFGHVLVYKLPVRQHRCIVSPSPPLGLIQDLCMASLRVLSLTSFRMPS
jgi:hypothetical protein